MLVPWSSGMIPPLQGGDHEFESRRNHSILFLKISSKYMIILGLYRAYFLNMIYFFYQRIQLILYNIQLFNITFISLNII